MATAASGLTPDTEQALTLHFEGESEDAGITLEPWVIEQFEYFRRLLAGGFSESQHGIARLACKRIVYETFLLIARGVCRPAAVDLVLQMEVLRFADMVSASSIVRQLCDAIRSDYLDDGEVKDGQLKTKSEGARDSAVVVLCELVDLLTPNTDNGPSDNSGLLASTATRQSGAQLAPQAPSPAAVWLVGPGSVGMATPPPAPAANTVPNTGLPSGATNSSALLAPETDPLVELREACLEALPPWTRQRFAERPQLWHLHLQDVLDVYSAEASPRAESSWLALHASRHLTKDILPFASVDNEVAVQLAQDHPAMVIRRCVSLCIRELPYSKTVSGFGGIEYTIQVALSPGPGGGWVLGVGGHGLCALRKAVLEIEGDPSGQHHELEFTGLMEHASGRQEDVVLGFASGTHLLPLPFSARLMILEHPLHLAVQTYIGLNFNTMAMLCQGFEFGPMDLACVMDLWLQSDQLRRVPEADISEVVRRTLRFVKLSWAPVVRVSFVVCMHSCWMQASHKWWHASLIRSCVELEVWRGPADGEPGAGTFRSYIAQIVTNALAPYPGVFVEALQDYMEALPVFAFSSLEKFFKEAPSSISDPIAIVARHYVNLLQEEASGQVDAKIALTVAELSELLDGFKRLVGLPLERSTPRVVVHAFCALATLCDLRHQRRLCCESLCSLLVLDRRPPDGDDARFWAGCFFMFLEYSQTLPEECRAKKNSGQGLVGASDKMSLQV